MSEVIELNEMIEQYEEDGYSIKDDRGAEYALKRIRDTQAEVDKFRAYYDEQIAKMQERADGISAFYTGHLQRYFNKVPHKVTKTSESYELPTAKLVWKEQAPSFVRDEEKVLEWLKKNDGAEYIKVKESLDWAGLKKIVETSGNDCIVADTGEVVPGIKVEYREPKFDVSWKKEGKKDE